jgi:hypothetical protein
MIVCQGPLYSNTVIFQDNILDSCVISHYFSTTLIPSYCNTSCLRMVTSTMTGNVKCLFRIPLDIYKGEQLLDAFVSRVSWTHWLSKMSCHKWQKINVTILLALKHRPTNNTLCHERKVQNARSLPRRTSYAKSISEVSLKVLSRKLFDVEEIRGYNRIAPDSSGQEQNI